MEGAFGGREARRARRAGQAGHRHRPERGARADLHAPEPDHPWRSDLEERGEPRPAARMREADGQARTSPKTAPPETQIS